MTRRHAGARFAGAGRTQPLPEDAQAESVSHRKDRLERLLGEEIEGLLRDEAADPRLEGVRVVSVTLSVDGRHARIGYVVEASLEDEGQVRTSSREALARASGFLRARLASSLDSKRVPNLSFGFIGVRAPLLEAEAETEWGGEP